MWALILLAAAVHAQSSACVGKSSIPWLATFYNQTKGCYNRTHPGTRIIVSDPFPFSVSRRLGVQWYHLGELRAAAAAAAAGADNMHHVAAVRRLILRNGRANRDVGAHVQGTVAAV